MRSPLPRYSAISMFCILGTGLLLGTVHWSAKLLTRPGPIAGGGVRLHNGWTIHPVGIQSEIHDMPSMIVQSPDGSHIIVGTAGWHSHTLNVFEVGDRPTQPGGGGDSHLRTEPLSSISLPNLWRGICFGKGARLNEFYASGGPSHVIWRFTFSPRTGQLHQLDPISIPPKTSVAEAEKLTGKQKPLDPLPTKLSEGTQSFPGGMTVLPDGSIVVVDEAGDKGPKHADQVYRINPGTESVLAQASLTKDAGALTSTPDGRKVYVAEHGTGEILVLRSEDLSQIASIKVGSQPNALLVDSSGRLFCANTGADTVSVIDTERDEVVETIRTALSPHSPLGSIPNSLAISPDQKTLYVTNGGNNDLAVIDLSKEGSHVKGFIPTGWYPVSVAVSAKNEWIFVGVGKGFRAYSNDGISPGGIAYRVSQLPGQAYGPSHDRSLTHDYIMSGLRGGLSRIPLPTSAELANFTKLAIESSPYRDRLLARAQGKSPNSVLPDQPDGHSPFKHVLYIIKENRTYDQVLGDLPQGEGDRDLVLYGRNVTPNHHAIAENFVLLDNTYCDGEVSQDGWEWSTAANDSDWDIKATTYSYSGRGDPPGTRETIRPSNGYLWEAAVKHGLTVYSYGAKTFAGLFSPTWHGKFSEEWNESRRKNIPDHEKVDIFARDLKKAELDGNWPNLVVMSLTDDHTTGTRPGSRTPYASVGSNDLAIGKVVEAVTRSKYWPETAIFIIEDDAQNGPDHIDSHRTVALVASAYTKRGMVDHTMYTTSSLVRSIELCLGLSPMSQYDAAATAMFACFTGKKNLTPYRALPATVDLAAINPSNAPMARESAKLDFSDVDLADWQVLNQILWRSAKPRQPYPGSFTSYSGR